MSVLTNFPFEQVNVEVWAIEHTRNITGESSWSNSFTNTSTAQTDGSSNAASFEDPNLIDFMEKRGYYLFDIFCYFIPDYIFVKRNSDLFRRLAVPQKLWKRRGLCLHKTPWTGGKTFNASKYRDSRHWPRLEFSPDGKE
ncbi:hypothetical protein Pcinc_021987 [Petrolisthes cinctipes]|uniref:Uncharacterized protein n=1 Tax=Petrolisthes cinctipes TaxID=88211 RepID=A0AAE1KHQ4_PETCI|nr:hypothetical protein Pcinc_021987 [Petrolisthes cinctipes]